MCGTYSTAGSVIRDTRAWAIGVGGEGNKGGVIVEGSVGTDVERKGVEEEEEVEEEEDDEGEIVRIRGPYTWVRVICI